MNKPEEIEIQTWWKPGGGMMYNRECLPPNHPEHIYNYVKREFNVDPEDYGIKNPLKSQHNAKIIANLLKAKGYNVSIKDLEEVLAEAEREDIVDWNYEENYRY